MTIPQTPPDYDRMRVIERPDGFYWQNKLTDELFGPFATLLEAVQDMQEREDTGYGEGETLEEAEAEIGIAEWTDPQPHIRDE